MGFSAHKFTKNYKSRMPGKEWETNLGGVRRFEYHSRYSELSSDKEPRHKKPIRESKAKNDIITMVESLVKDYQGEARDDGKGLSSLERLGLLPSTLWSSISDAFEFCRIFRKSTFSRGLPMNTVVCEMLYDLGGAQRLQPSIFPVAATILRKVIQNEGDTTLTKARVWQEKTKLKVEDFKGMDEPSFENPDADRIGLHLRKKFVTIMCMDQKGKFYGSFWNEVSFTHYFLA
ncbi:hypothetical protein BKA58DRAFT_444075 [Alternaria rosae]|uniref:uncharacterized protein n=1 Tax=Alternaria rosae TaxID=1187941 RepID=UPI001E8D6A53|nr:uncharacterized protein BKA58DRAFT_444075 [Alternaria rosae]KAH6858892.1 hypothetical protein BKA58DRAFT_444075 [Alternaria rosae]